MKERKLAQMERVVTIVGTLLAIATTADNAVRSHPSVWWDFLFAVAVACGLTYLAIVFVLRPHAHAADPQDLGVRPFSIINPRIEDGRGDADLRWPLKLR